MGRETLPRIAETTCVIPSAESVLLDSADERSEMYRRGMISDGRGHDWDGRDDEGPTCVDEREIDRLLEGVVGGTLDQVAEAGASYCKPEVFVRSG
jgi:hypothetical protein